jgi:nucleotide-binding universal stress UspA family protein
VELGGLYENFVVLNEKPYVDLQEGLFPLAAGGRFEEEARRVLEKLERDRVAVLVGPKGIGKSTLAAYVVWKMLSDGKAEAAIRVEKSANELALKRTLSFVKRKTVVLYDPSPLEVYYKHKYMEKTKGPEEVIETLEELADFLQSGGGGVRLLVVLPTDLYEVAKDRMPEVFRDAFLEMKLNDRQFLHSVIKTYSSCEGEYGKLAEEIAQLDGGYTLVAKYAGLWLRSNGCNAGDVERAVEEAKSHPKLFLAHYVWHVLLRGSGDLARKTAVPLLLHAYFGPVPVGVAYITKAISDRGIRRFLKPEELEGVSLKYLKEDELEPIAKWLAQQHEDLVKEALKELAGFNGEKARELYKKALSDLIEALDWARDEALNEGGEILAKLGFPEDDWRIVRSLLAFVNKRLAAVFKYGESKRCWARAVLIAGHALAGRPALPRREQLPEDVAEALGDVLKPCAVDTYLTIDGEIPPLSIYVAQPVPIRELSILSPLADTETIKAVKKTAEGLLARWRKRGITPLEAFYALGLAALAAGAEVDEETADLLLYAAPSAVQGVAYLEAVGWVLAALRPLGEKAPHRYVVALAAASEPETPYQETAQYIYDALQQLRDRLLKAERRWPLVEAVRAYSNLLTKHLIYIMDHWEEAVADMCRLYGEVRNHGDAAAPDRGHSAQRLFSTVAGAYVLATALYSDVLAPLVQRHCGLGDLVKKAETVRSALEAAAHPDELRKIAESDADFAEWLTTNISTGDAGIAVEMLRAWFTAELARYKLNHALDERGELDAGKLEETAKELEKAAEIYRKLEMWRNYLASRGLALRARVLAAKSWEELLERAKGFWELWSEAEKYLVPTAGYLAAAAAMLDKCLVYLAASGDRERAEELVKERRWLLKYVRERSVATRLMLKLFGVGEGAKPEEVVEVFEPQLSPEFRPALLMLAGHLQRDKASDECARLSKAEVCVDAVAAAAGNRVAAEKLRSKIKSEVLETYHLLGRADGRALVEVLAPRYSPALFAFLLLAAVEGRADAVRLQALWGSAKFEEPLPRRLFRAVYENCGDLNNKDCRTALLKSYYNHF